MDESKFEVPEQLILARQADLLRTFYKTVAGLTGVALLLIAFLPGFATSEDVVEPFVRNVFVILTIGVLYFLVEKELVLASLVGTVVMAGVFAAYSAYMESPGNMQMLAVLFIPVCIAGLLPRRLHFWTVYTLNLALLLFTIWLMITYRGVEIEYRSIVTLCLLLTLLALLIDVLSSSYRHSLKTTFSQLSAIREAEERLSQLDADLASAVNEKMRVETATNKGDQSGRLAFEAVGAGSILIDIRNDHVELSPEFLASYGPAPNNMDVAWITSLIHVDDRTRFETLINQPHSPGDRIEGDYRLQTDSPIYWMIVLESDEQATLQGIVLDVTYRALEQQHKISEDSKNQESQRLESLGVLAGAIAHDFNNLLHVIMLNADLARKGLNVDSKSAISIDRLMTTVDRAAELCSELLAYSGRGQFTIEPFEADKLVNEMRNLLDISTPKGVSIEFNSDGSNPTINGDITQLRQVVLNLITNAGEAVGNRSDGVIKLSVATVECDAAFFVNQKFIEQVPPGSFTSIVVEDNGAGMDEITSKRMFDPFYTTKDTGHGLGLSAVLGIVRGHDGTISVESLPGIGTKITLLFPLSKTVPNTSKEADTTEASGNTNLILFVDDETEIRKLADAVLTEAGFDVIHASDGQQAIEVFEEKHEELVLVVLDLMMPNKTGLEAYLEIAEIDPAVPVVFSSGFNESELLQQLPPKTRAAFLKKPYLADDLRKFVDNIIGPRH